MERVHVTSRQIDESTISAEPAGEIDLYTAPEVKKALQDLIDRAASRNLILNLEQVSFIDSSGLALLIGILDQARAKGMKIVAVCPTPSILRVLKLTGLMEVLPVCHDESQALQALAGKREHLV